MIDTHCHLNFKSFRKNVTDVIAKSKEAGVDMFVIPGTNIDTSKRAVELAQQYEGVYAAVAIHPHHVYEFHLKHGALNIDEVLAELEKLIGQPKVVAIGEVGLDRHIYKMTKYQQYAVDETFVDLQKELLIKQIDLAFRYNKALILHNWEAVPDILGIVGNMGGKLHGKAVFHDCEPDERLLEYAIKNQIYIGVDGDVTYGSITLTTSAAKEGGMTPKQEFVKKIPLELLLLETDSPFLLPEPLRTQKLYPNTPANIPLICEFIAKLRGESKERVAEATTANARKLFLPDA